MIPPVVAQVTIRQVRPLFAGLMQQGQDALDVLRRAGIDPLQVAEGKARLDVEVVARAWELAEQVAGPDLGLLTARAIDFGMFGTLSGSSEYHMLEAMAQQPTVRESLAALSRYSAIGFGPGGFRVLEQGEGVRVAFALDPTKASPRAANDFMAGMAFRSLTQWTGNALASARFRFMHAAPASVELYGQLLTAKVSFGAEANELWLDEEDACRPLLTYSPRVAKVIAERADAELASLGAARSMADEVRAALSHAPPGRDYSAADVADALHVSLRTLRRKLSAEHVSYQQLVDEHRAKLALVWLRDEALPVVEIATRLGFAGQSAFNRAFRRWYGLAPSEVRAGRPAQLKVSARRPRGA